MIDSINTRQSANTDFYLKHQSQKSEAIQTEEKFSDTDKIEINTTADTSVVYSKDKIQKSNAMDLAELKRITDSISPESLRNYVKRLLLQQGTYNTSDPCNTSVLDNNDFSIEAVSDRIMEFAIAVSGNDTGKLDELKTAIDKGFEEARKAFGGELPDICNQTHDKIMEKLDDWYNKNSTAAAAATAE